MATEKKKTYQILVNRFAIYEFAVDAASPEDACKILQRELHTGQLKQAKGGTEPVEAYWSDPTEKGDEWAVICSTKDADKTHTPILTWDGVKMTKSNFPDIAFDEHDDVQKTAKGGKSRKRK